MSDVDVIGEHWECECKLCRRLRAEREIDAIEKEQQ